MSVLSKTLQDLSEYITRTKQVEKTLSGIKDVDLKILSELDDESLLRFCVTSKYGSEICKDETFWRNRLTVKYPDSVTFKDPQRTWKSWYLNLTYFFDSEKFFPLSSNFNPDSGLIARVAQRGIKNKDLVHYFTKLAIDRKNLETKKPNEYETNLMMKNIIEEALFGAVKAKDDSKLAEYLISLGFRDRTISVPYALHFAIQFKNLKLIKHIANLKPADVDYKKISLML